TGRRATRSLWHPDNRPSPRAGGGRDWPRRSSPGWQWPRRWPCWSKSETATYTVPRPRLLEQPGVMTTDELRQLLESVRSGRTDIDAARGRLGRPAVADLGFAQVDLDRRGRCGFPEVIFCEGKAPEWIEGVARRLAEAKQDCLGTRVSAEQSDHL